MFYFLHFLFLNLIGHFALLSLFFIIHNWELREFALFSYKKETRKWKRFIRKLVAVNAVFIFPIHILTMTYCNTGGSRWRRGRGCLVWVFGVPRYNFRIP
jgi:hypothetical protein